MYDNLTMKQLNNETINIFNLHQSKE